VVVGGGDGQRVGGANLVGGVAACHDAVSVHHHSVHLRSTHVEDVPGCRHDHGLAHGTGMALA
jgi:hypothetical protein